jgi:hypothetical protein
VIGAGEGGEGFGAEEAVGVGDDADGEELCHVVGFTDALRVGGESST